MFALCLLWKVDRVGEGGIRVKLRPVTRSRIYKQGHLDIVETAITINRYVY